MRTILLAVACVAMVACVACGGNVKPRPEKEYASIFEAAEAGDLGGVRDCMRSLGDDVNQIDEEGNSVLHYAAIGGNEQVIRELVDFGAEVDALNDQDMTPLQVAQEAGQRKAVKVLTELGATE